MAQRDDYTATAAQTVFTYTFQIFETDEIDVYVNDVLLIETTDYTVSNNTLPSIGGTITLVVPSTAGDLVALVQDIPITRLVEYQTDGDWKATTVNSDFNRIYALLIQGSPNADISDRLIKFADSVDRSSNTNLIPAPVDTQYLAWNSTGDLVNTAAPTVSVNETPTVANVAAVKALDVASVQSCYMESLSAPRDGGQNHFYYDASSSATPDDQLVIKPDSVTLPANGRWLALPAQTLGIQDDAVTTNKILDANVTKEKIANVSGWQINQAQFIEGQTLDISGEVTDPHALTASGNGLEIYVIGATSSLVYQYTMTTANDLSTGAYASKSFDPSTQEANCRGVVFKDDGTSMYIVGSANDTVFQYTLSTPWDVSTASYASKSKDVSAQATSPRGVVFNTAGTTMYIADRTTNTVFQYTLSTAWDVSTASYASKSKVVSSEQAELEGLSVSSDGVNLIVIGLGADSAYQYEMTTAGDVSTATYSGKSMVTTYQDDDPQDIAFSLDGTSSYIAGASGTKVYQIYTQFIFG